MDNHLVFLFGIMLVAGAFGGTINHFQTQAKSSNDPTNANRTGSLLPCLTIGIGAAFIVPLFLNMISSDLLVNCKNEPTKMLVFAGFCLVASISSKPFIGTISNRVLELAKKADEKAERAHEKIDRVEKDIGPVIEKESEPITTIDPIDSNAMEPLASSRLALEEKQVLRALCHTQYTFRSLDGISKHAELSLGEVTGILNNLVMHGLVRETLSDHGPHWCLTQLGRETARLQDRPLAEADSDASTSK